MLNLKIKWYIYKNTEGDRQQQQASQEELKFSVYFNNPGLPNCHKVATN